MRLEICARDMNHRADDVGGCVHSATRPDVKSRGKSRAVGRERWPLIARLTRERKSDRKESKKRELFVGHRQNLAGRLRKQSVEVRQTLSEKAATDFQGDWTTDENDNELRCRWVAKQQQEHVASIARLDSHVLGIGSCSNCSGGRMISSGGWAGVAPLSLTNWRHSRER